MVSRARCSNMFILNIRPDATDTITPELVVHHVRDVSYSAGFLFLPRIDALCNLGPPVRHFLKAAMED
uniref:Uncharacterized protein n=1 Tax=Rhizophora mucronata TaxID=61149 RepID=A0A2P2MYQ2_RHIMU